MVPIGLCSIATLYLIGDGILRTSPKRVAPPEHEEKVKELFRHGDYVGAYKYTKENPSPLDNVLRVGCSVKAKKSPKKACSENSPRKTPACKPTLATSLSSVFAPP